MGSVPAAMLVGMRTAPGPRILRAVLACLVALACGCSSFRYERAWNDYTAPEDPHLFEGRWSGTWRSERNEHAGGLRCIVTAHPDGGFLAWFDSTYGIFSFRHKALFVLTEDGPERIRFAGEEDLGLFGGVYRYEGSVEGDRFDATYRAENEDQGVFTMTRVGAE